MKNILWVIGLICLTAESSYADNAVADFYAAGKQLYIAKDYQGALGNFEEATKTNNHSDVIFQAIGNCDYFLKRYSEAIVAYDQALELNPNNAQLAAFVKRLKDQLASATNATGVTEPSTTPAPTQPNEMISPGREAKLALSKNWWLRAYSGYDYSLLGDVINSITAFPKFLNSFNSPGYMATSNTGNSGIQAGIELGFLLDKNGGFSINAENIWSQSESFTGVDSGTTDSTISVTPSLMSISLNYYRYLFQQKGGRTFVTAGIGYYQTSINFYDYDINVSLNPTTATFTGDTLGGTLGIGEMIGIGDSFGLEISAHGRIATFNQVSSPSINQGGNVLTGPYSLGVANEPGIPQLIFLIPPGLNGSNWRNLIVDYSGFDANLSFSFYF